MAARVRVTCSTCGDVVVTAASMTATLVGDHGGCFAFACPTCQLREARPAEVAVLQLLARQGAAVVSVPDPARLEERFATAPLTEREVAALALDLADDEWFEAALAALCDGALDL